MVERKVGKAEVFLNILTEDTDQFFLSAFLLENTSTELEGVSSVSNTSTESEGVSSVSNLMLF